eukprot:2161092-Rhodomonas_salina.1
MAGKWFSRCIRRSFMHLPSDTDMSVHSRCHSCSQTTTHAQKLTVFAEFVGAEKDVSEESKERERESWQSWEGEGSGGGGGRGQQCYRFVFCLFPSELSHHIFDHLISAHHAGGLARQLADWAQPGSAKV